MTAETQNDSSLFDDIASLLPAKQREHFYRRMAHLERLAPNDEILQIAEAMGFLALLTRQTPFEMAAERLQLETLFHDSLNSLKVANETALAYQADIDQRLKDLPTDVASALSPKGLATLLSETIRQRFQESGIPAISESLAQHAENLRDTSQRLNTCVVTFADPQHGAVVQIGRALGAMQANLDNAASHIRSLSHALVKDLRRALAVLCLGSLIIGFFLGFWFCQWIIQQHE